MGFGSFQGQNGVFRRFRTNSGIFVVVGGPGTKDRGPCEIWKFWGDFS
jgi:hypothetical protein